MNEFVERSPGGKLFHSCEHPPLSILRCITTLRLLAGVRDDALMPVMASSALISAFFAYMHDIRACRWITSLAGGNSPGELTANWKRPPACGASVIVHSCLSLDYNDHQSEPLCICLATMVLFYLTDL